MQWVVTFPGVATTVALLLAFYLGGKVFASITAAKWRPGEFVGPIAGFLIFGAAYLVCSWVMKNILHIDVQDIFGIVRIT